MRCPNCRSDNPSAALSCANCGSALQLACAACGFRSPLVFRFCGQCGHMLAVTRTEQPAAYAMRERRQITVLFCDLVGSTRLSARLDAEDFGDLIGEYFQLCKRLFEGLGGYVDREEGDSLRVYFGYPQSHDDDAVRAVKSALEIASAVTQLAGRSSVQLEGPLQVHIGIHTGEVVTSGNVAGRKGPLVVGEVPNIAKRLQETAGPGTVHISAATLRLIEGVFTYEAVGAVPLKGIPSPVQVYRVTSARGLGQTIDLFENRILTPLVGRAGQLEQLMGCWTQAKQGGGAGTCGSREPGIGKSRLLHAFVTSLARDSGALLTAQCQEHFSNSAYFPSSSCCNESLASSATIRRAGNWPVCEAGFRSGRLPQPTSLPLVASLLLVAGFRSALGGVPAPPARADDQVVDRLDTRRIRLRPDRVLDRRPALGRCLDARCPCTPGGGGCIAQGAPAHLVVAPSSRRGGRSVRMSVGMTLTNLSAAEAGEIVKSIIGGQGLPEQLLEAITSRSDGVPLFVEELTKMLLESGALAAPNSPSEGPAKPGGRDHSDDAARFPCGAARPSQRLEGPRPARLGARQRVQLRAAACGLGPR